jgi:SAM-dependent methyltransferase
MAPPRRFDGIEGRVHRNDLQMVGHDQASLDFYRQMSELSGELCERAWRARSTDEPAAILDFGSGHGRCLRKLHSQWPHAAITACDLDHEAVEFCASEFGAIPLDGDPDITKVDLGRYDVIWMGSVLTHVDESASRVILETLAATLRPGGAFVFTTIARNYFSARAYWIDDDQRDGILAELDESGVAHRAYPHYSDEGYGLTWHEPGYVRRVASEIGLEFQFYEPAGWGSQDAWGFTRPQPARTARQSIGGAPPNH